MDGCGLGWLVACHADAAGPVNDIKIDLAVIKRETRKLLLPEQEVRAHPTESSAMPLRSAFVAAGS